MSARVRRIACADETVLRVLDEGEGPAALLLHGFTGRAETLDGIAAALAGRRRVIRPDLLGHGESDAPADPAAYAMDRCLAALGELLDALDVERADLLGYSMGGRVALSLAANAPDRVRALVLVGASPGLAGADERAARIAADEALARSILDEGVEAFTDRWMALPLFASQQRLGAEALAAARAQRLACRAVGLAGSLRGLGTGAMPPLHAALPAIRGPVLLVVGALDEKFRSIAQSMAADLPDARVEVIPDAGHAAHLEQPARFAAVLREFLDRVSPVGGVAAP